MKTDLLFDDALGLTLQGTVKFASNDCDCGWDCMEDCGSDSVC